MSVYKSTDTGSHKSIKWRNVAWREWARSVEYDLDILARHAVYQPDARFARSVEFYALLDFLGIERMPAAVSPSPPVYRRKKRTKRCSTP